MRGKTMGKLLKQAQNLIQNHSGQSLILVVIFLPVMLGMAAAGVTVGTVYFAKTTLQNAVDAAALAGAKAAEAGNSPATQSFLVGQNDPNVQGQTVVVRTDPNIQDAVEATATEYVPGGFAGILGFKHFTVTATGIAAYGPGQGFGYAIFQGSTNTTLAFDGGLHVKGSIHANQNITLSGGSHVTGNINASGTVSPVNSATNGSRYSTPTQHAPVIPMPSWPLPPSAPEPSIPTFSGTVINGNFDPSWSSNGVQGNYIVHGNVNIGGGMNVNGSIEAYGNITIGGGDKINGNIVDYGGVVNLSGGPISGSVVAIDGSSPTGNTIISLGGGEPVGGNVIATGGNVTLGGDDPVTGSVWVSNGSIDLHGSDSVGGSVTAIESSTEADTLDNSPGYVIKVHGGDPVTGNITANNGDISLAGGQQVGGYVVTANGNVSIGGGSDSSTAEPTSNPIAILAEGSSPNGNITVQGGANITGIVYAPDGTVSVGGGSNVVGALIGEYVNWAGNLVTYNTQALSKAPLVGVRLIQ
ncbi:MAG: hypothetical protein C7B46_05840 [Sulfobacillus benefaciens]|uniref:Uncharacterized protein n=1 Tax=Sulfobacillus benefaciens TaxID=453960 RepID=A0A2T2XIX8_9FIRM|nr:MAG: hypothetical protein C7B46_05840 [Sulfobacillus benefaciens]